MATNDFQPFAYGGAANVVSQSAYLALTTILQNGFSSGVAQSAQLNKVWRQSSIMAAVLAQFSSDYSGQNSTDDGTTATLETNLIAAIRGVTKTGVLLTDTGAANAYTASNVPALTSGQLVNGLVQQVVIAHANTGASTYAPDGLTAYPIYGLGLQALQGGELYAGGTAVLMRLTIAGINSGNPIWLLMECAGGAQQIAPATQSQHALQLGQATGRYLGTQIITSSQTVNPGVYGSVTAKTWRVRGVGGGGGSSGAPATAAGQVSMGGGGQSGAYCEFVMTAASTSATVGAAGAAGAAGATGGTGGTSTFGALASLPGGVGGTPGITNPPFAQQTLGATGGPSGTATFIASYPGALGAVSQAYTTGSFYSGAGGSNPLGVGGNPSAGTTGQPGFGFGSGSSGPALGPSASAVVGLIGRPGVWIVDEFA